MNIRFLVNRLRRMSLPEIVYRIWRQARDLGERLLYAIYIPRPQSDTSMQPSFRIFTSGWNRSLVLRKADRICRGRFDIFALKNVDLHEGIDYHTDYQSGRRAPHRRFGKSIDYRNYNKSGDVKYIWELNRHLFLFTLARAYAFTRGRKYLVSFTVYLTSWLDQNPFPRGVNWASALEVSVRLTNWALSWLIMEGVMSPSLRTRWLRAIHLHCRFIRRNFSAHSSANNHLIGEAAGLFVAATVFSGFRQSGRWRKTAFRLLERECIRQTFADGVNREQTVEYTQFVLDFFFLALAVSFRGPHRFSRSFQRRLERTCLFLGSLRDRAGHLPALGDGDDGFVFDADQRETGLWDSVLAAGFALLGARSLPWFPPDGKTMILLSLAGKALPKPPPHRRRSKPLPVVFPEGGYVIMGRDMGKRTEEKLVFDAGPLGYLSLAAHGHADALSFTYSFRGFPLFIDPGTFTYFGSQQWRRYFRGTAAHNTLRLDGRDQSEQLGRFMWGKKARARFLSRIPNRAVRGEHDGYGCFSERVIHEREIRFHHSRNIWEIRDTLKARMNHRIELFFHLAPQCRVTLQGNEAVISFSGGQCSLFLPDGMRISLHRGEEKPICGWYSPCFDVRSPTITVKAEKTHTGACLLVTKFSVRTQVNKERVSRL